MKNRWLVIILLISAALNLLLAGAFFGRFAGQLPARPFPPHLGWIVRQLEPETRQALRPDLMQFASRDRELRRDLMATQRSVNELFLRDPLDKPTLEKQLARLRDASAESQQALHQAMLEIMLRLDVVERRKVLSVLQRNWRDEFRHRRGRQRPGGKPAEDG